MTDFQSMFNKTGAELSAEAQAVLDGRRQQAAAFREAANRTVDRAMNAKGLTDRARQAVAARTYRQTQAQQNQLMADHIAGIEAHRQKLIDRAFGARGGDAQALMARRQAQQMVTGITEPWQAKDLLRTAQQDGDTQLAQVVAGRAYSMGWLDIVDTWGADNQNAMRNLADAQQLPDTRDSAWRMNTAMQFHTEKPSILSGLREQEIDSLAHDDLGDAA